MSSRPRGAGSSLRREVLSGAGGARAQPLPLSPRSLPGGGNAFAPGTSALNTLLLLLCGVLLFTTGVTYGAHHYPGATSDRQPWSAHTRNEGAPVAGVRLPPPGVRGNGVAVVRAAAAVKAAAGGAPVAPEPVAVEGEEGSLPAPLPPTLWADFDGRPLPLTFSVAADALDVSGGAWVYLARDERAVPQTVLSNRAGGCAVDDTHRGFALFINTWQTADRSLILEWRDEAAGGCGRLASDAGTIPFDTWVHVAFALSGGEGGKAMLFLNGVLLRTGPASRLESDVQVAPGGLLALGGTIDAQYPLTGRLSQVFVVRGIATPRQLSAAVRLPDALGWWDMSRAATARLLVQVLLAGGERMGGGSTKEGVLVGLRGLPPDAMSRVKRISGTRMLVAELTGNAEALGSSPASGEGSAIGGDVPGLTLEESAAVAPLQRGLQRGAGGGAGQTGPPASIARGPISGTLPANAFDFSDGGNQWVPRMVRLPQSVASGSVTDPAALAAGTFSDDVTLEDLAASDVLGRVRAASIKGAMSHAWRSYVARAWGSDELKPVSGGRDDNWSGMGMTLIDSLDTLWVMGMMDEFNAARDWVASSLSFGNKYASVSMFETTIRALGGLLAAHDLSGEKIFLTRAQELADKLVPAFNTPTGIPRAQISLGSGQGSNPSWTGGSSILSELGTLQVEFRALSRATGISSYGAKSEAVIAKVDAMRPADGLYPIYISPDTGVATSSVITFGALGDSFYEYLLKVWVQGGRIESRYRRMYDAAMEGMTTKLLKRSKPSGLAYVADMNGGLEHKMDHLVCFVPGMLALGAYSASGTPDGESNAIRDLTNAKALAYTCWQMYARQVTGLAPEFVEFPGGADLIAAPRAAFYILRPEAAESLYILHQLTGNPIYREWGWRMFEAIEQHCKTAYGYGAHPDVRDPKRTPDDRMESFFLAETLKYLYLLQSPDHTISLDSYVFNTEAHPTRIFPLSAEALAAAAAESIAAEDAGAEKAIPPPHRPSVISALNPATAALRRAAARK